MILKRIWFLLWSTIAFGVAIIPELAMRAVFQHIHPENPLVIGTIWIVGTVMSAIGFFTGAMIIFTVLIFFDCDRMPL